MLQVAECDLSSLASVRQLAARLLETENRLELLVNCAGVALLYIYSFPYEQYLFFHKIISKISKLTVLTYKRFVRVKMTIPHQFTECIGVKC